MQNFNNCEYQKPLYFAVKEVPSVPGGTQIAQPCGFFLVHITNSRTMNMDFHAKAQKNYEEIEIWTQFEFNFEKSLLGA